MDNGDPVSPGICLSNKRVNLFNALSSVISPTGTVHLDSDAYSCESTISVSVADADLKTSTVCSVVVTTNGNDSETVLLSQNTPAIGVFQGSATTSAGTPVPGDGVLQVSDGHIVTVAYVDESGTGRNLNRQQTYTDTAVIDGQAPMVSHVLIDASSPQPSITFETDTPAMATVQYGVAGSQTTTASPPGALIYKTYHTIVLNEMSPETDYTFVIEVADRVGNTARYDNDGMLYRFTTIANPGPVYVPADYDTIQTAMDQCWDGETVWVADGIYTGPGNRDLDFKGKAITVRSENGPEGCIIDCQGSESDMHRGFYFHNQETSDSVLDGFTITRGFQEGDYSNGTICRGGGILCNASSPTIRNCVFRNNSATYGGGLYSYGKSDLTLINCVFDGNTAQRGAGANNDESTISATDCLFINNNAISYYGGLFCGRQSSQAILTRCIFRGNSAFYGAGALGASEGDVTITHCEFTGNTATGRDSSRGGAINTSGSGISIQNCIFSGNESSAYGGGLYHLRGQIDLVNCTFVGNAALDGRTAACLAYGHDLTVLRATNCIFWDGGSELFGDEGAGFDVRYSNIRDGFPGEGNMDEDPCFVNPGYWDDLGTPEDPADDIWFTGDYHLQSEAGYWSPVSQSWITSLVTSPCIDAGDPDFPVGQESEPNGGRINIGAYGGTEQASRSPI
jgi:hypothetical protein